MFRIILIISMLSLVSGCGETIRKLSDDHGAQMAPGQRGKIDARFTNPAGLKVPATSVYTQPSHGYWNCGQGYDDLPRPEHKVRCTLDPNAPVNPGHYWGNLWGTFK